MSGKYFTCEIHNQHFETVDGLKQHALLHHSNNDKPNFQCEVCKREFQTEFTFERHKSVHQDKSKPSNIKNAVEVNSASYKGNRTQQAKKSSTLATNSITVNVCQIKKPTATTPFLKDDSETKFQCHICALFFSGESMLSQHMASHLKKDPLLNSSKEVDIPPIIKIENITHPLRASSIKNVPTQINTVLNSKSRTSFNCGTCSKTFRFRKALNDHLKAYPEHEMSLDLLVCKICNKIFTSQSAFSNHNHISKSHLDTQQSQHGDSGDDLKAKDYKTDDDSDDKDYKTDDDSDDEDYTADDDSVTSDSLHDEDIGNMDMEEDSEWSDVELLEDGVKNKETRSFKCGTCQASFRSQNALNNHLKDHVTREVAADLICKICNRTFANPTAVIKHTSTQHPGPRNNNLDRDSIDKDKDYESKDESETDDDYQDHVVRLLPSRNRSSTIGSNNSKLLKHGCYFCGKSFRYISKHERHIWSHTNERPLSCRLCPKSFYNIGDLKMHINIRHLEGSKGGRKWNRKPFKYKCAICSNSFRENTTLRKHFLTHSEKRSHQCKICQKSYKRSGDLRKHHLSKHTTARPYKCEICLKTFKRNDLRNTHLKLHKEGKLKKETLFLSNERRFPCKLCPNAYTSKEYLSMHVVRIHSEKMFRCKLCNKRYGSQGLLNAHVQKCHSTTKPFKCKFCFQSYARQEVFKVHMKRHQVKGRQYECAICRETFATRDDLISHRKIHEEEPVEVD